jgi:hypothetical protein
VCELTHLCVWVSVAVPFNSLDVVGKVKRLRVVELVSAVRVIAFLVVLTAARPVKHSSC